MSGFINVRKDGSSIWHSDNQFKFGNGWENALGKVVWNLSRFGVAKPGELKDVNENIGAKFSVFVTNEVKSFVIDGKIDFGNKDTVDKERLIRFIDVLNSATKAHGSKTEPSNVTSDVLKELGF